MRRPHTLERCLLRFGSLLFLGACGAFGQQPAAAEPSDAPSALGSTLSRFGLETSLSYVSEGFTNPVGGLARGYAYKGQATAGLTGDLEKGAGLQGLSFSAGVLHLHGDNLSDRFLGDIGPFSNIEAANATRVFETWLEYKRGPVSVRAGLITIDSEFNVTSSEGLFCNGTFGSASAILLNMPSPGFPFSASGVRVRVEASPKLYASLAVCDGNSAPDSLGDPSPGYEPGHDFNSSGLHVHWSSSEGVLAIAEIGSAPTDTNSAGWCAGAVFHSDTSSDLTEDRSGRSLSDPESDGVARGHSGNFGAYVAAEAPLRFLGATPPSGFVNVSVLPSDRNAFPLVWRTGLVWTGFWKSRPDDSLGLAFASTEAGSALRQSVRDANRFGGGSERIPDAERVLELTCQFAVTKHWILQPDVQWLHHPGGSAGIPDALVVGLRSTLDF